MFIYKIENKVNGKIYIGKTNNFNKRKIQHFPKNNNYENKKAKILYSAIKKYGQNNFEMKIIEKVSNNWEEREKFWIAKFNSKIPNGYNMTDGGDNPPVHSGETHHFAVLKEKEVGEIKKLLLTNISYKEIAEEYKISVEQVYRINTGVNWRSKFEDYPIRKNRRITEEEVYSIVWFLTNTSLSQKEIGNKFNRSRTAITAINNGQNHKIEDLSYPIRVGKHYESEACID